MRWFCFVLCGLITFIFPATRLQAQMIAVQQPIVETFGVATGVSVPDRGWRYVGGVSRAGMSRSMPGPYRMNTNTGMYSASSSLRVGVFIHDFDEMDEAILASAARKERAASPRKISADADVAYEWLRKERPVPVATIVPSATISPQKPFASRLRNASPPR